MSEPICLESLEFDGSALMATHPPVLRNLNKKLVFDLCRESGYRPSGSLKYSRWRPNQLPESLTSHQCQVSTSAGYFDYQSTGPGVWHVNFADPQLFVAYGSGLLAQDEIQVLEHPILGSLHGALLATNHKAQTEDRDGPTPVLVQNAERACAIETSPSATSPRGLYGNRFQIAPADEVRAAVRVFAAPSRTNLIAIAAPVGSGLYSMQQVTWILQTAFGGFRAAALASSQPVEIHTGFWGCGAFGGNRPLMVLLQLLAAQLAEVKTLVFHLGSKSELPAFDEGRDTLQKLVRSETSTGGLINSIVKLGFRWGQSDGN